MNSEPEQFFFSRIFHKNSDYFDHWNSAIQRAMDDENDYFDNKIRISSKEFER